MGRFGDTDDTGSLYNPSRETLRELADEDGVETVYGSLAFESAFRSRSSDRTWNAVDHDFGLAEYLTLQEVREQGADRDMITLDFQIGDEQPYQCRYHVPQDYARIALALDTLFERYEEDSDEPDFETYHLPDQDGTGILVWPEQGTTAVLGSDYTGEGKKSFLRNFMYDVKQAGGLGLHAGTKRVTIEDDGLEDVHQLYFGLSGTGKSTLTSHGFGLEPPESAEMLQDDVVGLLPDGTVIGTEGNGLYSKTNGLTDSQEELYRAVTSAGAVLENVDVDRYGHVDFHNTDLTANGRAVVPRDMLESASEHIDMPELDQIYFIARNSLLPPIAKLTDAQAASTFMLGESVETGAADPEKDGDAVRVPGFNPFIIGPPGEEGNRLHDLIADTDVDSYLINTGDAAGNDIGVDDTVTILDQTTRGTLDWELDDVYGMALPTHVDGIDLDAYYPPGQLDDFAQQWESFTDDRQDYLDRFDTLNDDIRDALL